MAFKGQTILVTGGTGSFGKKFIERLLKEHEPKKIIIFSRDEFKQFEMQRAYANVPGSEERLRFFLGDVRDSDRLKRAFNEVDIVVHAAALKQVPMLEYNPFEAIKTNVLGAENIINMAIDQKVTKVLALSTDKAVNPINLYGATKLCAEKLFVAGNYYAASQPTHFSVVRYGNVIGSRGSVIPFFLENQKKGVLPITHKDMTRFWITLDQGVTFVLNCLTRMQGGEVFVPKIPSMKIVDLARCIGPTCELKEVGIRPGEKLHEILLTEDEARSSLEFPDSFVIKSPAFMARTAAKPVEGKTPAEGYAYASNTNTEWLTPEQIKAMVELEKKAL